MCRLWCSTGRLPQGLTYSWAFSLMEGCGERQDFGQFLDLNMSGMDALQRSACVKTGLPSTSCPIFLTILPGFWATDNFINYLKFVKFSWYQFMNLLENWIPMPTTWMTLLRLREVPSSLMASLVASPHLFVMQVRIVPICTLFLCIKCTKFETPDRVLGVCPT